MEERIARLEANVENIKDTVCDLKKTCGRLEGKIERQDAKIDTLRDSVAALALQTEKSFAKLNVGRALDKVWWLLMSAALLGVMARGFKWI